MKKNNSSKINPTKNPVTEKITLDQIMAIYHQNSICLGELLNTIPAKGLSIEEAFLLYIEAMKNHEKDRFFRQIERAEIEEY